MAQTQQIEDTAFQQELSLQTDIYTITSKNFPSMQYLQPPIPQLKKKLQYYW